MFDVVKQICVVRLDAFWSWNVTMFSPLNSVDMETRPLNSVDMDTDEAGKPIILNRI